MSILLGQALRSLGIENVSGCSEAMALALKQNALKRRRRPDPTAEALPMFRAGPKFCAARKEILVKCAERLGSDTARECSWVLAEVGSVPVPMGVPSLLEETKPIASTPHGRDILLAIRRMAREHYRSKVIRGLSVPKISTTGFPHFRSGEDGLQLKECLIRSYIENLSWTADALASENWRLLASSDEKRMAIFFANSPGYRLQPSQAKMVKVSGGVVNEVEFKKRMVQDAAGALRVMDMSLPYDSICQTMRSRSINQCPSSSNLLNQLNEDPYRASYYARCAVFHIPDVAARVKAARQEFPAEETIIFCSFDFGGMEKSETAEVFEQKLAGMRQAGVSEALINLKRAIHFSAYLLVDDDYRRPTPLPVRLVGKLDDPNVSNDLGKRSGEADTDTDNKDVGFGIYCQAAYATGALGPLAAKCKDFAELMDKFGDAYLLQGKRMPGARVSIPCNMGDDVLFCGYADAIDRIAAYLEGLSEVGFDIKREADTQFLGCEVLNDGTSYPYPGKFFSNFLSPERPWTSKTRVRTFPLGIRGRLDHYATMPNFGEYKSILDEVTMKYWNTTVERIASQFSVNLPVGQVRNVADALFLTDPTVIQWGRIEASDVSPDLLRSVNFYLNIAPERVEQCQI